MKYSESIEKVFGSRLRSRECLFSFWTHFPHVNHDAELLAAATVELQRTFDLDFVKTMPNCLYGIEDYGAEIGLCKITVGGDMEVLSTPFLVVDDWEKLTPTNINRGAFARELRSLSLIRKSVRDIPILFTVYSPITILSKLSQGRIFEQIASHRNHEVIHRALGIITDDLNRLCKAALELGATGIFFENHDTSRRKLCYDDFCEFVNVYDIEIFSQAHNGKFNVLSLQGDAPRFYEFRHYPVDAISWHFSELYPSANTMLNSMNKCLIGGINHWHIMENDLDVLQSQINALMSAGDEMENVIVAPGYAVHQGFDTSVLHFVRDQIRSHRGNEPKKAMRHPLDRKIGPLGRM